jgi:putative heme iron utilization protein
MTATPPDHQPPAGSVAQAPTPPVAGQAETALSHPELARTLLADTGCGSLATLTISGHPFGSVAPYVADDAGRPVLCVSELAEHTRNARRDPRASLLVVAPVADGRDPLGAARVTLVGELVVVPDGEVEEARRAFLAAHPGAAAYVDYGDFSWWRLEVGQVRYVGGFGSMSWVDGAEYAGARPDPVVAGGEPIMSHMNADHADANLAYVRAFTGLLDATAAAMVGVDARGMDFAVTTPAGPTPARVAFPSPVPNAAAVQAVVIAMLGDARKVLDAKLPGKSVEDGSVEDGSVEGGSVEDEGVAGGRVAGGS